MKIVATYCMIMICALGCAQKRPEPETLLAKFYWQDGLKSLEIKFGSHGDRSSESQRRDLWKQLDSTIQERVSRANLRKPQGTLTATPLGTAPSLIDVKSFEIEVPPFSELLGYVESENTEQIKNFISLYHDIDQRDLPSQRTALFYAATGSRLKALQALIALGADPNIPDFEGDTALMAAVTANSVASAKLLIQSPANINQADENGITTLMRAVELGQLDILKLLLEFGADPNYVSHAGYSALRLADERGDKAAMTTLRQFGAAK